MRPGVSLANAIAQVDSVQYHLHLQYPNAPVAEDAVTRSNAADLARDVQKPLSILTWAVACMLLIGCLNVLNLLVARGAARQKEVAIRNALGAQRFTLIREQLSESLIICFAGGALGVLLSIAATRWLAHARKDLCTAQTIHIDVVVLAFACGLVFLTLSSPACCRPSPRPEDPSSQHSRWPPAALAAASNRSALRKLLLSVEIAVTAVLLIAAGLLVKSFIRLRTADVGCTTDHVLTLDDSLPAQKYDKPEKVKAFNQNLLARLRSLPGVRAVALGSMLPGNGYGGDDTFSIPEHPPVVSSLDLPDALYRTADPGYFSALQVPLIQGRFFTEQDRLDRANKVIISRQLARQYFPSDNPMGKHLHVPSRGNKDYEVVDVVGDTLWQVGVRTLRAIYFPLFSGESNMGDSMLMLAVRTASDPPALSVPV
jgi:predicted permease